MRRKNRPVGIAVATATLLLSTSLSFGGAAFAAPSSSDAGTTNKTNQTSTGVAAGADVPSGAVMVVLNDQLSGTPATAAHSDSRRSAASNQQDQVMGAAGISTKNAKHFSLVNGFATTITPAQAKKLAADPRVKSIVPDVKTTVPVATDSSSATSATPQSKTAQKQGKSANGATTDGKAAAAANTICPANPKKPLLEPEALSAIKAANQTGDDSAQKYATGKGVKVAVMAEGLDPNAPDYKRADGTSAIVDYQNFSGAPESTVDYGEEIFGDASSIAAQGTVVHDLSKYVNISHALPEGCNIQIRGVAPGASIVALNVLGGGDDANPASSATASAIVQAIDYAVTVQHVDVISESLGSNQIADQSARNAVQQFNDAAVAQGVTVFASTGDAGVSGTMGDPAVDPLVIGVGATTTLRAYQQIGYNGTLLSKNHTWLNGNIGSFSSGGFGQAGNLPVIVAPGDSGWAACTDKTDKPGCTDLSGNPSSMELFGGTSQSSPITAGVGALVIQAYKEGHQGIAPTPAQVRQILTGTATNLGAPGQQQGVGQVDALAAVKLAKTFGNYKGAGTNALTVDKDQLQVTGAAGQPVSQTVTVNNNSNKKVVLSPAVKSLQAISKPTTGTASILANGPAFLGAGGNKVVYKTVTFKVPANVDQYTFQFSYGNKDSDKTQLSNFTGVNMSLISPSGQYVGNTRPQGGSNYLGTPNYGRFDVVHPAAGTWTAVFASGPSQRSQILGDPIPTATYTGPIDYAATMNHWVTAGSVSAKKITVQPFGSAAFTANTTMASAAGDSSVTVSLGAPANYSAPTIPISQRVLVSMNANGGSFKGTMTGGNGRGGAPASQDTFALNVPAGKKSMQIKVGFDSSYAIQGLRVGLVDPNGVLQQIQANQALDIVNGQAEIAGGSYTTLGAVAPIPGQWRIVVWQLVQTFGRQVFTPYTGTVSFNNSGVSSSDFAKMSTSSSAVTSLPAGQQSLATISITNTSSGVAKYSIDPRTATLEAIQYPSYKTTMPSESAEQFGSLTIPAQTQRIDATVSAPVPVQALLSAPGVIPVLAGMSSVGNPAPVVNGVAQSTASLSTPSGQLTMGDYAAVAGSVGPFGSEGAPKATATVNPTVYTAGFDTAVTTDTGDMYQLASVGVTSTIPPISVASGATVKVTVKITPQASVGSVVSGRINVVRIGETSLYGLLAPYVMATDQVIEAFDYHYKVAPAQTQIKGTVTGMNNVALGGVTVDAFDSTGALVQSQRTAADGTYGLGGLTVGAKYRVCFDTRSLPSNSVYNSECYKAQTWDGTPANIPLGTTAVVAPAVSAPTTGIDANLTASSTLTGLLTDQAGNPVAGALLYATGPDGNLNFNTSGVSGPDGKYSISGINKSAVVCVLLVLATIPANDHTGLVNECGGVPWGLKPDSMVPTNAKPVDVASGQTTVHNIALSVGYAISGNVKKPDGTPAVQAIMAPFDANGFNYGSGVVHTDANGNYMLIGMPGDLPVTACSAIGGGTQVVTCSPNVAYNSQDVPPPAGAKYVSAPAGQTVTGADITLVPASVGTPDPAPAVGGNALKLLLKKTNPALLAGLKVKF